MAMSPEEIEQKVVKIVAEKLNIAPEKITRNSSFVNDLGADSLDTVELIMGIEDAFQDLSIPDDAAEQIQTVGSAIDYVVENTREK